ncbi:MAG: CHAT domain-containing protein [Bacteroidia bacterium]|nr:CHAT domain-containing protein [Bacteroidia bacterium]
MRYLGFLLAYEILMAQTDLLHVADSLSFRGYQPGAIALYDSLLHHFESPDSIRLRACLGAARAALELRQLEKALNLVEEAKNLTLRLRDTSSYVLSLIYEAAVLRQQRHFDEAEAALLQGEALLHKRGEQTVSLYGQILLHLGLSYHERGKHEEAQRQYLLAKAFFEQAGLKRHLDYPRTLYNLGVLLEGQGRYAEAERLYIEVKEIRSQLLGVNHPDYARILHSLAVVAEAQGRFLEAERLYIEAREIRAQILGEAHPEYALTLSNLANVYRAQGRYVEAEKMYLEAKKIQSQTIGIQHPDYVRTLNNLAVTYTSQGRYSEAERLFIEVKELRARMVGEMHPAYATVLNNLGNLYWTQGRYEEAERIYLEAKRIWLRVVGNNHPHYAATLNNLAVLYQAQNRYKEAETLLGEVRDIRARVLGRNHPQYATSLNNLAIVLYKQGLYAQAETLHREVKDIRARVLGTHHPDYATTLDNLANACRAQGRYEEAERLFLAAMEIRAQALGTEHPDYYHHSLYNLASLYRELRRYSEADTLWKTVVLRLFSRLRSDFPTMPAAYRENLLENILYPPLLSFQTYTAERAEANPSIGELGYRAARSFKGVLLTSVETMKHLVENSADSIAYQLYEKWRHLADQYALSLLHEEYGEADSVRKLLIERERYLIERLPSISDYLPDPAGEPLFPPLRKKEALVEVVRVPLERADSVLYLFYILLPGYKEQALYLHVHRVDTVWEKQVLDAYEIFRSPSKALSGLPHRLLWGFIDSVLPGQIRVVYFSPDGIYYRVNVGSLYNTDRSRFVADRYDVRYVATSRRLLMRKNPSPSIAPIVIGNPAFYAFPDSVGTTRVRIYRGFPYGIPPLPGAEKEAQVVGKFLGVNPVVGEAATEDFVKRMRSPRVLHVATHGYFTGIGKNPMLEGGLLLAQAAVWDSLYPPPGGEDGRLTAQEASNLNLLGTELVVLSACETGLGEVKGEGLYGLQRAFLEAGAARVIATLWPIDDAATQELMIGFYRCVRRKRGEERVDKAFAETMKAFRRRYPQPYYWGAFVMVR